MDDTTYAENIDWSFFAIAWTARFFVAGTILNKRDKRRFSNLPAIWFSREVYDNQMRRSPRPGGNYVGNKATDLNGA